MAAVGARGLGEGEAGTRVARLPLRRPLAVALALLSLAGLGAVPTQANAVTQRCYIPSNKVCANNVAGDFAARTDPWISASVFSGNSIQSFFNNLTNGTAKRQLMYLRNGPNNFSFWYSLDTTQQGRLWYINYSTTSYVLSRCQTLGGGTVTIQCGEVLNGDSWIAYPN